jgi:hypothetical protein
MDFISPFLTLPSFLQFFMLLLHILSIFRRFSHFPSTFPAHKFLAQGRSGAPEPGHKRAWRLDNLCAPGQQEGLQGAASKRWEGRGERVFTVMATSWAFTNNRYGHKLLTINMVNYGDNL